MSCSIVTSLQYFDSEELVKIASKIETSLVLYIKSENNNNLEFLVNYLQDNNLSDICYIGNDLENPVHISKIFDHVKNKPESIYFLRTNKLII